MNPPAVPTVAADRASFGTLGLVFVLQHDKFKPASSLNQLTEAIATAKPGSMLFEEIAHLATQAGLDRPSRIVAAADVEAVN